MKTLFQIVNSEIKLVNEWFLANKLSLNAKKKQNMFYFISRGIAAANYDIE